MGNFKVRSWPFFYALPGASISGLAPISLSQVVVMK
jgi:hypothetical protein